MTMRKDKIAIEITAATDTRYTDWEIRFRHNPQQATVVSMTNADMAALWAALSEHHKEGPS